MSIRINLYLSRAGLCSRREADDFIKKGLVSINGVNAVPGSKVEVGDRVFFKGKELSLAAAPERIFIAFNKPRGIICTTDRRVKDNIVDFLAFDERIFPIGRLDRDSSGLILLTNDGSIVNPILRAEYAHEKEYFVRCKYKLSTEFLKKMAAGVPILDTITKPAVIKKISAYEFRITLTQGLNRQIRRMCEALGNEVVNLERLRIMNISLGNLKPGSWRSISYKENRDLVELLSKSAPSLKS